jgi:predicted nucleic acid-binding protein
MGRPGHPARLGPAVRLTGITYDSGALIAAERGERRMWARHRALLLRRVVPVVPAPVVAQCWRGTPRQAQLARLLAGCEFEPLDEARARATGVLAGRARTSDIVDACVVEGALRRDHLVISSDVGDLSAIAAAVRRRIDIDHP